MQADPNAVQAARTGDYYDQLWEEDNRTPDQMAQRGSSGEARIRFIQDSLKKIMEQKSSLEILDIGCGMGWIETFISSYGTITAIDFSPRTIEAAREKYGTHAHFLLADSNDARLGLPHDKFYDVVLASEVIEHVNEPQVFVNQIASFLKPGGWCILTTPNARIWKAYQQDERYRQWHQPIENWLTAQQCSALFKKAGFRIIQHEGWSSRDYPYTSVSRFMTKRRIMRLVERFPILSKIWKMVLVHYGVQHHVLAQKQKV